MITVLIQDTFLERVHPFTTEAATVIPFTTQPGWRQVLVDLAETLPKPLLLHCSLEVGQWIQNTKPSQTLVNALSLPKGLEAHAQTARLGSLALNQDVWFLPFENLIANHSRLQTLLGQDLFLRPNSPYKPFAGRPWLAKDGLLEIHSLQQIERVAPDELCMIAPAQTFSLPEWRFWIVDGEIATYAPYAFDAEISQTTPPASMKTLAKTAADRFCDLDPLLVVDCVMDATNTPKVMELNAWSTSGFYNGMDHTALWTCAKTIFA